MAVEMGFPIKASFTYGANKRGSGYSLTWRVTVGGFGHSDNSATRFGR